MATVTGFTAERMLEIEDTCIVDGAIVGNDLVLEQRNGTPINAGNVRGPTGPTGPIGEVSTAEMTAAISAHNSSEVTARNAAIAAAVSASGWQHIADGDVSNSAAFTITIPDSTYKMVKVHLNLAVSGSASAINARVNNNSTTALHRYSYTQILGDGTVSGGSADQEMWRLGVANTAFASTFDMLINNADGTSTLPWQCLNTVFATSAANVRSNISSGRLTSGLLMSSLRILPSTGLMTGYYICEGYKVP